jgi:LAS superfamily LD-carboxypeptidase LdcB
VKKHILNFLLSLIIFFSVLFIFFPYLTTDFLDLRQKKENEENYQKFLKEQLVKKEAIKKIQKEAQQKIYLTGKFDPSQREDFAPIPAEYNIGGYKMYLRRETLDAFLKMRDAAEKDEIDLKIASATRNFNYQKELWNNKWTGAKIVDGKDLSKSVPDGLERFKKILEYSAVPGTSRHHWGTDIDINKAEPIYFNSPKGIKEYEWLTENAPLFGFCQTYNLKGSLRPTGYNEEKWHWSYLPLSREFMQEYKNLIKDEDLKGFLGDEYVKNQDLINNYVLSINPDCL